MKRLVLAVVLSASALMAMALPTVEDVQAEVAKGNIVQAEEMMRSVVQAKPGSARAHYVYAEILARGRHYAQAAEEAARAKAIDPSVQFTQPEQFEAFEQMLARERSAATKRAADGNARVAVPALPVQQPAAAPPRSGGVPGWVWGLGLAAVALVAWRAFGGRREPVTGGYVPASAPGAVGAGGMAATGFPAPGAPMAGGGGFAPSYGSPYPPVAPVATAGGRNWLGTGLAAAGGVAAGMMAERLLEGHRGTGQDVGQGLGSSAPADAPGLRGMAPGLLGDGRDGPADAGLQHELDQRPIDFGTGDEWGGDAGAGDGGSAGSDDGW